MLGTASTVKLAEQSKVDFRDRADRVYHRGLELQFPEIMVRTYGSVGFDQSLAIMAEMNVPPVAALLGIRPSTVYDAFGAFRGPANFLEPAMVGVNRTDSTRLRYVTACHAFTSLKRKRGHELECAFACVFDVALFPRTEWRFFQETSEIVPRRPLFRAREFSNKAENPLFSRVFLGNRYAQHQNLPFRLVGAVPLESRRRGLARAVSARLPRGNIADKFERPFQWLGRHIPNNART